LDQQGVDEFVKQGYKGLR